MMKYQNELDRKNTEVEGRRKEGGVGEARSFGLNKISGRLHRGAAVMDNSFQVQRLVGMRVLG